MVFSTIADLKDAIEDFISASIKSYTSLIEERDNGFSSISIALLIGTQKSLAA